ncbi:MAG: DUF4921 family protein [Candidatus Sumerlaeia bacterium]|nr:DUF4921 family protein [Candidatus Sumerlaeia bacterium]
MAAPAEPHWREDPVTRERVIIAPLRAARPFTAPALAAGPPYDAARDPFAPGNESETPPEIAAVRAGGAPADGVGWTTRLVPNRYPALTPNCVAPAPGPGGPGHGFHEVLIESPGMEPFDELPPARAADALVLLARRVAELYREPGVAAVEVFKNHGRLAGASLEHPHFQLLALPFLPARTAAVVDSVKEYAARTGRDLGADHVAGEEAAVERLLHRSPRFLCACPFASRVPFEQALWRLGGAAPFHGEPEDALSEAAEQFRAMVRRMRRACGDPPYNALLRSLPPGCGAALPWSLHLLPRRGVFGGFEWATGAYINSTPPEDAAARLRAAV